MAAAELKIWVKGVPATKTLLDCPFCHRVLLTAEAKKVPYDLGYIDFAAKPDWLAEKSGGKVPVINQGDDFWMPDSDAIVEWLEAKFPAPSMKSSAPPELCVLWFWFPVWRCALRVRAR